MSLWTHVVGARVDERAAQPVAGSTAVVVIVVFFIGFGLLVWWMARFNANARKSGAQALGDRPGWTYVERDDSVLVRYEGWPFTLGERGIARFVTRGVHRGRSITAFGYRSRRSRRVGIGTILHASLSSRKALAASATDIFHGIDLTLGNMPANVYARGRYMKMTVIAMEMPAALPAFLLRIQLPTDRVVPGLRSSDIDLGEEGFDDAYLVRAETPQLARDLLTPANQNLLLHFSPYTRGRHRTKGIRSLRHDPAAGFTMWTSGRNLMVLTQAILKPGGHEEAIDLMANFLDNVPRWVWDAAYGRRPASPPAGVAPPPPPPQRPPPPPPPPPARPTDRAAPTIPLSPSPISDG